MATTLSQAFILMKLAEILMLGQRKGCAGKFWDENKATQVLRVFLASKPHTTELSQRDFVLLSSDTAVSNHLTVETRADRQAWAPLSKAESHYPL